MALVMVFCTAMRSHNAYMVRKWRCNITYVRNAGRKPLTCFFLGELDATVNVMHNNPQITHSSVYFIGHLHTDTLSSSSLQSLPSDALCSYSSILRNIERTMSSHGTFTREVVLVETSNHDAYTVHTFSTARC